MNCLYNENQVAVIIDQLMEAGLFVPQVFIEYLSLGNGLFFKRFYIFQQKSFF